MNAKRNKLIGIFLALALLAAAPAWAQHGEDDHGDDHGDDHSDSRFSDEPIPLADIPNRPRPLIEIGPKFLGTGTLAQGIRLPTGAVWQPAFMAFGTLRTAVQGADNGVADANFAEAASRFDLFGNLYLTQTERVLVGFRPLDQNGAFTRYTFSSTPEQPDSVDSFQDELNFRLRTLFFEGDLGEIFPALDWDDSAGLDFGISVGRQPLSFQDGLLINEDAIDAAGLTQANRKMRGLVNLRLTGLVAWNDIDRPTLLGNRGDKNALLVGLFTEIDSRKRTVEFDAVYVSSEAEQIVAPAGPGEEAEILASAGGDGLYVGVGSIRRLGRYSSTLRIAGSLPLGDETFSNRQGLLISEQLSWTPHHSHNHIYISAFAGIDAFRSAARAPSAGGPLGMTGLLFASVGLGSYGAALGNAADDAVGGAVGYQMFFDHTRKQLIVEAGGRYTYQDDTLGPRDAVAAAARFQAAVGRRGVLVLDAFGAFDLDDAPTAPDGSDLSLGGRVEVVIKL